MRQYYVNILANRTKTIYTGVTNNLECRIFEHKHLMTKGFAYKYKLTKLVYYEVGRDIKVAIFREKQIKECLRKKKNNLD
jgi:Predicted endonuclease containing a URI domain